MNLFFTGIFYILVFLAVYVQVFFLVTFLENRKKIITRKGRTKLSKYPGVTVIVPCWNEEKTIAKTVESLLDMNYPKDKIQIFLVDDGSTDKTWEVISGFANPAQFPEHSDRYKNIKVFHKENGGKHTALNLGLEHTETEFVGCLDADSTADPESLIRIMSYFENSQDTMAVAPSIIVNKPRTLVQKAQNAEYDMAIYIKKMLGIMGAIHVTPGPLTIFRKKVFDNLGPYRHAHNTEDMEIAYRMQTHHYKIEQCNDAYVYTNTPNSIKKLYKQRLRWIYGFINNTIDYRKFVMKKEYGNFAIFTVPAGILSVFTVSFLFGRSVYNIADFIYTKYIHIQTVGIEIPTITKFDPFFINTQVFLFVTIILYALVLFSVVLGRRIVRGEWSFSFHIVYFFIIFSIVAPFWLMKAIYNTVTTQKPSWR